MTTCVYTEPFGWVPHAPKDGDDIVVIRCAAGAACGNPGNMHLDNATLFLPDDYVITGTMHTAGYCSVIGDAERGKNWQRKQAPSPGGYPVTLSTAGYSGMTGLSLG